MNQIAERQDAEMHQEDQPLTPAARNKQDSNSPSKGWSAVGARVSWRASCTILFVLSAIFTGWYAYLFYDSIRPYWFHPAWTTDDALQQVYPFHRVLHPNLFKGDIITEVMIGYLAPIHYWISYGITWLTGDPIMMSHYVMLIQMTLTIGFFFLAIRRSAGMVPALLGVAWLLHTRNTMQRITGGLPRGWSTPVFAAFLYFAGTRNHVGVLITILVGCLTNPPAALLIAVAYGFLLVWGIIADSGAERRAYFKKLLTYAAVSPLLALITLYVVHRPPNIGQMVSYEEASQMVEFSRPFGRFPFIPFNPPLQEIRIVGLEAFVGRFYNPPPAVRTAMPYLVVGSLLLVLGVGAVRRRVTVPREVLSFGVAALTVYFLSRLLAFRLYVPNRHLQIPMAVFFISAFTIGIWRAFYLGRQESERLGGTFDSSLKKAWPSMIALVAMGFLVWTGSRTGLVGAANFNYAVDKRGYAFEWLKKNSPEDSLIAGHPTHIDPAQLFAARQAFVTTETTHPFYTRYYAEMKRRTEIALRAHYSTSLQEFAELLEPEGIDYFIFKRSDFYPDKLPSVTFFPPFKELMQGLTSQPIDRYVFRQLLSNPELADSPVVPFKDRQSIIVDIEALKHYLTAHPDREQVARMAPNPHVTTSGGMNHQQTARASTSSSKGDV